MKESVGVILLKVRDVYGTIKYYPANDTAELFCKVAKTKTMTEDIIKHAIALGYEVRKDRVEF